MSDIKPITAGKPGLGRNSQWMLLALAAAGAIGGVELGPRVYRTVFPAAAPAQAAAAAPEGTFRPTDAQRAGLTIKPVATATFRDQRSADGKIAVDDDVNTPVYPPYAGRVTQVFVKAGDRVKTGDPLFRMDSTDLVQAETDDIAAVAALAKARSQSTLLATAAKRQQALLGIQGAALKDVQQAQADLTGAENDQRSAETALAAVRDRLRILGLPAPALRQLEATKRTDPALTIPAPLAGLVTLRKLGPGQYLSAGASDPVITVGDLKTVWLVANVREGDAPAVHVGQDVDVRVTAFPDKAFKATISYVAPSVDPATHRLPIRAEVQNDNGLLKPEMFASFTIAVSPPHQGVAVPEEAVVYDGDSARVWAMAKDGTLVAKPITTGDTNGHFLEALSGVAAGDQLVTKGSIFIDRAASAD